MNKKFLFCAVGLLAVICLTAWLRYWFTEPPTGASLTPADIYAARLKLGEAPPPAESVPKALPWNKTVRLAIGGLGYPNDAQNQELGDLIAAQLSDSKGLELVERQQLDAVLHEQALNLSGLVRAEDAVRTGKLLRADWFLLGTTAQVHGTNCLVVRLVDARTGITRDGTVFVHETMPALAGEVADFVRQQRQAAVEAKPRVYLAIGTFEDLSVNNRQAGFPRQLRGYLTAAYQHSRFTLLEREYADLLLQEMELDLAGLTQGVGPNAQASMQSAFWLVDGYYQSYETTNLQVEVTLDVQRIFGTSQTVSLRGPPGEGICRQVKDAIDTIVNRKTRFVIPTQVSELRAQMEKGKELYKSAVPDEMFMANPDLIYAGDGDQVMDPQRAARCRRNLEEAMRAFNTALLLNPDNHEAKIYLAACLRNPTIDRLKEAREYYREIIEDPVQDQWSDLAQRALVDSFEGVAPDKVARFFGSALRQTTNSSVDKYYRRQADIAEANATIAQGKGPTVAILAERRLYQNIHSFDNAVHNKPGILSDDMGMDAYAKTFGTDRTAAAERLVELLPKMEGAAPDLKPYLVATVVSFQTDTNAPVIAEFQTLLKQISEQHDRVLVPDQFWNHVRNTVVDWSFSHKRYALAAQVMEAKLNAENTDPKILFAYTNEDRISLAYAYRGMKDWRQALGIFDSFSNTPVQVLDNGPWGRGMTMILTGKEADYCRQKLGLASTTGPREFEMGPPCFCLCSPSAFAIGKSGLWIGINGQLLHLNFNLKTNLAVNLPIPLDAPVSCFCLASSNLWIGTDGAGLFEYDKASGHFRHWTQNNGLLMNKIAFLNLSGNTLWIGYGRNTRYYNYRSNGGLGKLGLSTGYLTSFTPPLKVVEAGDSALLESGNEPSRQSVTAIANGAPGDIWFITDEPVPRLHRYRTRDHTWKGAQQACTCIVSDSARLYLGQTWNYNNVAGAGPLGVSILDLTNGHWRSLGGDEALPSGAVTALALDGNDLWVGGMGYVALIHLPEGKVRGFARIQAQSVDQIGVGGGYVWAEYNGHLHRVSLGDEQ